MPSFNTGLTLVNTYKINQRYGELYTNFYSSINLKEKYSFIIEKGIDIKVSDFRDVKCNCVNINAEYFNITNDRKIIFKDKDYCIIATYEVKYNKLLIICAYNKGYLNFRTIGGKLYDQSIKDEYVEIL